MSLIVFDPITYAIIELVKKAVSKTEDATKNGDMSALQTEEARQEVSLRMAERQAKVAQEVAIARRIELAEEVEIEEFYDVSGEGGAGVKTDGETASLGELRGHGELRGQVLRSGSLGVRSCDHAYNLILRSTGARI